VRLFDLIGAQKSGDVINAEVHFRSEQDAAHGPEGLTCVDWHLDYSFSHVAGLWLIRKTTAVDGQPKYTACS
jgi:serine protease Do